MRLESGDFAPSSHKFRVRNEEQQVERMRIICTSLEGLVDREELCWLQRFEIVEARRRTNDDTILLDG